jgi:carbonic anhydrase
VEICLQAFRFANYAAAIAARMLYWCSGQAFVYSVEQIGQLCAQHAHFFFSQDSTVSRFDLGFYLDNILQQPPSRVRQNDDYRALVGWVRLAHHIPLRLQIVRHIADGLPGYPDALRKYRRPRTLDVDVCEQHRMRKRKAVVAAQSQLFKRLGAESAISPEQKPTEMPMPKVIQLARINRCCGRHIFLLQVLNLVYKLRNLVYNMDKNQSYYNRRRQYMHTNGRWLDAVTAFNKEFKRRIEPAKLPTQRSPGAVAVITCMDPRVNLEAIGIPPFTSEGEGNNTTRIIRTIGAMAEERSLFIGIFLAGISEIAVLMHTDCGCCAAYDKMDVIVERLHQHVEPSRLQHFKDQLGEPFIERLRTWLKAFSDPYKAVRQEVEAIKAMPFAPRQLVVHGLVYNLATGGVDVVVNGYDDQGGQ